ncbi:MAG TPA: hypothetical protein VEA59_00550 [Patescibacteria group bacterium]|nr:hypothetical protein [Patescibacteria group bacterium]
MSILNNKSLWIAAPLFLCDLALIALYFYFGPGVKLFDLDLERNIPTYYQGFQLIFAASLIFTVLTFLYLIRAFKSWQLWLLFPYWLGFVYLALDEVGFIHESLHGLMSSIFGGEEQLLVYERTFTTLGYTSTEWLLFYWPAILASAAYFIYLIYFFRKRTQVNMWLLCLAVACFFVSPVLEFYTTSTKFSDDVWIKLVATEEFAEMVGVTLFIVLNFQYLQILIEKTRQKFLV